MQEILVKVGNASFVPVLYNRMLSALADCVSIDDCNEAQSQAAALAVYYKQAHDEEAERAANEIRLRAWRRMAEIIAAVNVADCKTQKAMVQKVRDSLGHDATSMLSDSRLIQMIKLAGVPDRNFEEAVAKASGSIAKLIRDAHPAEIKARQESIKARDEWHANASLREKAKAAAEEEERKMEDKRRREDEKRADEMIKMVKEKAIVEVGEVGLTLSPKAKANLVAFSVMMDRKMHDQLRDAAHDRRTTMWAILREASNYWFVVNGYEKV